MAGVESRFHTKAGAGTSTAKGLFQFTDGTWADMLNKYGSKYGLSNEADRFDPRANALMGAEYIKENYNYLRPRIGRDLSDTDIYSAHFLGAGDARRLLTADPSADAVAMFSRPGRRTDPPRANVPVFYEGNRPRKVGEVVRHLDKVMQDFRPYADYIRNSAQDEAVDMVRNSGSANADQTANNLSEMNKLIADLRSGAITNEEYTQKMAELSSRMGSGNRNTTQTTTESPPTSFRMYDGNEEREVGFEEDLNPNATSSSVADYELGDAGGTGGGAIMNQVAASAPSPTATSTTPLPAANPQADNTATTDRQHQVQVASQQNQAAQATQYQQQSNEDRNNRLMESYQSQQLNELRSINGNVVEVVNVLKSFNMHEFKTMLAQQTQANQAQPSTTTGNEPPQRGPWKTDQELGPPVISASRRDMNAHNYGIA